MDSPSGGLSEFSPAGPGFTYLLAQLAGSGQSPIGCHLSDVFMQGGIGAHVVPVHLLGEEVDLFDHLI